MLLTTWPVNAGGSGLAALAIRFAGNRWVNGKDLSVTLMVMRRLRSALTCLVLSALVGGGSWSIVSTMLSRAEPYAAPVVDKVKEIAGGVDWPTLSIETSQGPAAKMLASLPVKGRAPKTGYARSQFGSAWSDAVTADGGHNGCDQRSDVLRRDLVQVTMKPSTRGCVVASGVLHDPYTGRTIRYVRGADASAVAADHVVALGDAWQSGAQSLTAAQRAALAGDPLNLLIVDGRTNSAKGDSNAASWLPPARAIRCQYVARQIAVKARYHLWVTTAEKAAMVRVLSSCPSQGTPEYRTPPPRR